MYYDSNMKLKVIGRFQLSCMSDDADDDDDDEILGGAGEEEDDKSYILLKINKRLSRTYTLI